MIRFNRAPDKHAYLVDTAKSHTRNVFKLSSSLGVIMGLCAFSIWAFTPVSEQVDYTLDQPVFSKPIAITAVSINSNAPEKSIPVVSVGSSELLMDMPAKPEQPEIIVAKVFDSFSGIQTDFEPSTNIELPKVEKLVDTITSAQPGHVKKYKIQSGDTLTKVFEDANLPISQAIKLSKTKAAEQLNRLSLGKQMRIFFDQNNQWESLEYDVSKLNTLIVTPKDGSFDISTYERQVEYRDFAAHGFITSSLGAAAQAAGMSMNLTYGLMDIYKWEIDFARDLRKGDAFSVVYQKAYVDGEFIDDGPILAASFSTNGRTIEAVRYTDGNDVTAYFQPNGESLRRGFLRTPIKLARITSGFGSRLHPISKKWKKHNGVDYGAKGGTAILSTADGVVQYAGNKGGYGKTIILRHGGIYTTLYAHMSKFAKGVRSGKPVEQGQIIGYVGRTGWATGNHLHYEFRVNGSHKDPLKVKLPRTLPLAKKEVDSFSTQAQPLLATLAGMQEMRVARNYPINNTEH